MIVVRRRLAHLIVVIIENLSFLDQFPQQAMIGIRRQISRGRRENALRP